MIILIAIRPESQKDKKEIESKVCSALHTTSINKHMREYEVKTFNSAAELVEFFFPRYPCMGELIARIKEKVTVGDV